MGETVNGPRINTPSDWVGDCVTRNNTIRTSYCCVSISNMAQVCTHTIAVQYFFSVYLT